MTMTLILTMSPAGGRCRNKTEINQHRSHKLIVLFILGILSDACPDDAELSFKNPGVSVLPGFCADLELSENAENSISGF